MANWNVLKTAVANIINANNNQEITGQLLQNVLNNIITNVGENATFAGIATTTTNPGAPDGPVFYLATTAGVYPNFNGLEVLDGEAVVFSWNNSAWSKKVTGFATQENINEKLSQLGSKVNNIETKIESKTITDTNEDTVSDLWKKGNTFTLEVELSNITQIYGLYGSTLSDGYDLLGDTNSVGNGITLQRDYYAIRCYNTKGIEKTYHVFGSPNLSVLSYEFKEHKININERVDVLELQTNYKTVTTSAQDAVSDLWKKGCIFTLDIELENITQIYGMYGKTLEEGFDLIGSNIEAANGIVLSRDYYAIRCYNTEGIEKIYKVFRSPNLKQIYEQTNQIKSVDFYFKNKYTHVSGINVGDYVPNFDGRVYDYNGTYSIHLPLTNGVVIKVKNSVVLGDFNKFIVIDKNTRLCTEAISIIGKDSFEYTAKNDCIIVYSTYSKNTVVETDVCSIVLNDLVSNIDTNKNFRSFFDYKVALSMDRTTLKTSVEVASCGKCTVIYDNNGYPSLMYKIPITSIASLNDMLGDDSTPHPAFVVNGETKKCIYAAVFMNSEYNGVPVSWFGLPTNGHGSHTTIKEKCKSKGEGWHMETIWERSLISLLSAKYHNNTPRGNNDKGRSLTHKYEYVELVNNGLPGSVDHGRAWINGSQPISWSHTNSEWGIYDIIGGYHERCDLLKIDNGKIIMSLDNSFNSDESAWFDTGVYLTWQNNKITIDTNIKERVGFKQIDVWTDMDISQSYDGIDLDLRKKMVLALITPYLSSRKDKAVDFNGSTWINDSIIAYPFLGGAAAYVGSSLGMNIMSYSSSEDHGNIGARLFYIE